MPLLPAEPDHYPPDLLDPAVPPPEGRAWYVCHTRPRQEKRLAHDLHGSRVPFFLPLVEQRRLGGGRRRAGWAPLFPGYVFLWGGPEERLQALKTNRLANLLEVADAAELWDDLRHLDRVLRSDLPVTPVERLQAGDRVRVVSGPLAGVVGTVERWAGRHRLLIRIRFLQRGVTVEVEDGTLEVLD
jgi:transcriptional antiterminator RfaH